MTCVGIEDDEGFSASRTTTVLPPVGGRKEQGRGVRRRRPVGTMTIGSSRWRRAGHESGGGGGVIGVRSRRRGFATGRHSGRCQGWRRKQMDRWSSLPSLCLCVPCCRCPHHPTTNCPPVQRSTAAPPPSTGRLGYAAPPVANTSARTLTAPLSPSPPPLPDPLANVAVTGLADIPHARHNSIKGYLACSCPAASVAPPVGRDTQPLPPP